MYGNQKEAEPTVESLQGELKAMRDEVQWLRTQLAMRVTFMQPQTVTNPPAQPYSSWSPNPYGNNF